MPSPKHENSVPSGGSSLSPRLISGTTLALPSKINALLELSRDVLVAFERDSAIRVVQLSDALLTHNASIENTQRPRLPGVLRPSDAFESALGELRELHHASIDGQLALERLALIARLNPGQRKILSPLEAKYGRTPLTQADLVGAELFNAASGGGHSAEANNAYLAFCSKLLLVTQSAARIETAAAIREKVLAAQNRTEAAALSSLRTELANPADIGSAEISQLTKLCARYHRAPSDSRVPAEGIVVAAQTEEVFRFHLLSGAQLLLLKDQPGAIKGFALWYEPNNLPEAARDIPRRYPVSPQAFVQWILVSPEVVGGPAHRQLLCGVLAHLQRTGAAIAVGRVCERNVKAIAAHYTNGWMVQPSDRVTIRGLNNEEAQFVGLQLPVDPLLRQRWAIVSGDLHARHSDFVANISRPAHVDATSEQQLVDSLSASRTPVLLRFTGGCGSMTAKAWEGFPEICRQAFDGFSGAMIFGATQMEARGDDGPTGRIRSGITEIPFLLKRQPNEAVFGGIVISDTDMPDGGDRLVISAERVFNESEQRWEDKPYQTRRHPDAELFITVDQRTGGTNKWHAEVFAGERVAEALIQQHHYEPLLVSYGGGGTTEFEIRRWANRGWQVLLITGGQGSTDRLAADPQISSLPNVHVVSRSSEELRTKLTELGALGGAEMLEVGGPGAFRGQTLQS